MRVKGAPLTQQAIQAVEPVRGDVILGQQRVEALKRYSDVAYIYRSGVADPEPLSMLYDAAVRTIGTNGFVITGYEIIDGAAYAQSWWCQPI